MKNALINIFWLLVAAFGAAVFGAIIGYTVSGALK